MADLTRFDFHALKFTRSFSIRQMSNEEIGQYILLLAEAWLGGKDTALPDNLEVLASLARCKKVSDKVLDMFPIVESGVRRNETLYGEWMATKERLAIAEESGRRGGESKKAAFREPIGTLEAPTQVRSRVALPITKPTQTDSYQTNTHDSDFGQGTFKNISVRYSSYFGINHSKSQKHIQRYQIACSKYGEDKVLEYFETWAQAAVKWLKERRDNNGLNFFWRPLDEIAEGDQLRVARETEQQKKDGPEISEDAVAAAMAQDLAKRQKQVEEDLKRAQEQKEFEEAHRDEI
jgi:uncharacterized protein YdaU (DUF1376 family)